MKTKLFTLFFVLASSTGTIFASMQIGDLYYNIDVINKTAEVTCQQQWPSSNYEYLTAVVIPEFIEVNSNTFTVTRIGSSAFHDSFVTSVTIGDSVTSIGSSAFARCSGLTNIEIPNNVTVIENSAFSECYRLTSVTLGNNVTEIGAWVFQNCSSLTNIEIPDSVTVIGDKAFESCTGLTNVTIGSSVTEIGTQAFSGCRGITSITCKAIIPPVCSNLVFSSVDISIPVYVPETSIPTYRRTKQWSSFTNYVALDSISEEAYIEEDYSVQYLDRNYNALHAEIITLHVPVAPIIEGFTFMGWQASGMLEEDGIVLQAIYTANEPSAAPDVVANPANPAQKLIRNGNVYILTDTKTYTIQGQGVK